MNRSNIKGYIYTFLLLLYSVSISSWCLAAPKNIDENSQNENVELKLEGEVAVKKIDGDNKDGNDCESKYSGGFNENSDGCIGCKTPWGGR